MTGYDAHGNFLPPQQLVDEIERLRAESDSLSRSLNGAVEELDKIRSDTIEECARMAETWYENHHPVHCDEIATAIRALKGEATGELPASRQLLNITKAALDHCEAECERLRLKLGQAEKIAKLPPPSAAEIERLRAALEAAEAVVNEYLSPGSIGSRVEAAVYSLRDAIRALKP